MTDNQEIEFIYLNQTKISVILSEWNGRPDNPPSLMELVQLAFPEKPNIDGRSKEAAEVKKFLATRSLKARGAQEYQAKEKPILTDEQKEFIRNNIAMMNGNEIAKILFKNESLSNLNIETRSVNEYIKTLEGNTPFEDPAESPSSEFKPPRTTDRMLSRLNRYILNGPDKDKLSSRQKKDILALINYVNTYRFIHQINTFDTTTDRALFESSFLRYTYDKPDLTQEEVDQYIILSTEVVIASTVQQRVNHLQNLLEDTANDSEGKRISMSLVDAINTAQTEYNQCVNRQQKLLGDLKEKRSDRLKHQIKENASILNLVQLWKEEDSRLKILQLAELRKNSVKKEIERLSSMDDIKCRILGISEEEILDG